MPCHLVAYTAFKILQKLNPGFDLLTLVQLTEEELPLDHDLFYKVADEIRNILFSLAKEEKLIYPEMLEGEIVEVVKSGIHALGIFHIKRPLFFDSFNRLLSDDFIALLFYSNKVNNLNLDDKLIWSKISL